MLEETLITKHSFTSLDQMIYFKYQQNSHVGNAVYRKLEETRVQEEYASKPRAGKAAAYQPSLRLHELRAETYNGLVRLLRPGCRTILLLLDTQSRPVLLPKFHKHVWPYRKNKTLMFAHLNLDRGLSWSVSVF